MRVEEFQLGIQKSGTTRSLISIHPSRGLHRPHWIHLWHCQLTHNMSVARALLRAAPLARRAAFAAPRVVPATAAVRPRLGLSHAAFVRHGSTLPPRNPQFTKVTEAHVKHLRSLLGSENSLLSTLDGSASTEELVTYNDDWMNKYHGHSQVVVKPKSTAEVAAVMKYCNDENIAVTPQGGNTGLVGE